MTKPLLLFLLSAVSALVLCAQTPVVNAKKRTGAITINGNPNESEWSFTNSVTKAIVGTPNNTVKYAVLWDSLNLYVAFTVTDANKFNDSPNAWDDDAVEVYIDAENNGGTAYGSNDRQFVKEWNASTIWEKNGKTTGVQHAWTTTSTGYAIEMLIPWSNIGITKPGIGFTIGFDVANDDDDNGSARESQLMWSGDKDNWQYPRNFGDLVLVSNDTQAPSAPASLSTSVLTQSSVNLSWVASTDNIAVTGYDIYRNGAKINSSLVTTTMYSVTGLSAATAYQFYVNAKDAAGNTSANSNTVSVTTPDTQAPTAPTALLYSNLTFGSLTLNWTASTDNVAVTGYDIYQNNIKVNTQLVTGSTYNVSGLASNTAYAFYVKAYDAAGNNTNSTTLNVTTALPPDTEVPTVPSGLNASSLTSNSVVLNWTASTDNIAVTGYDLYQNGVKINTSLITTTSYTVTSLTVLTDYNFYVQARDAAGNISANSNTINITTPDTQAPTAPSGLNSSNLNSTSFTLNWASSSDNVAVAGYDIYQDNIKINTQLVTSNSFDVSGLVANTAYVFYVKASDAAGNSTNSSTLNVITPPPPDTEAPSAPADLVASNLTSTSAVLSWTASTDNVAVIGYDIYKDGEKINSSPVTGTTYTATSLTVLTGYSFYIQARDAAGNVSVNSNTINIISPDTQAPTTPIGLAASNITSTSLTLNWTASTDDVAVSGYDVYQDNVKINTQAVISTTYNVTGLTVNTSYAFYIKASDAAGNNSNSTVLNITTPPPPDTQAPSAPSVLTYSNLTSAAVTLAWTAAIDNVGVTGYDVYRNGVKINSSIVVSTSYNVAGLTASTVYSFYVQAKDAAGNLSANSNAVNLTTPAAPGCTGTGAINFQKWTNITGTAVSNLTSNANYPNNPSSAGTLTSFEIPSNAGDNYGMKVYGYICPPATGTYTFWIAADDNAELWLSTNSTTASKQKIAYHTSYTNSREWNKFTTQKSAAITLTYGQLYYVEALMKDGTGGDNMAVGWAKPGQSTTAPSEVIPGSQLLTRLPDTQAPSPSTNLAASIITQSSFTLSWTAATDNVAVTGYDVYRNNVKVNTANITGTSFSVTGLTASTVYSMYVVAKDAAGNSSASNILNVTTGAPDAQAPSAPSNLSSAAIEQVSFTLRWDAATDNVGVVGYDIYSNGVKVNSSLVTDTRYIVTGLTAGNAYTMTVIAQDAAGNASAASIELSVTTLLPNPVLETFTQRTVIANQRMPHDLVYGPDNNIWYTERFAGTVSFVNPATGTKTVVLSLGSRFVNVGGQDGLLGLALHPQFRQGKPYVYISYTYQSVSSTVRKTRIERYTYDSVTKTLGQAVTILENIPGSNDHNSARLSIGPDLKLYYSVGDMGAGQFDNSSRTNNAQNLTIYEGKILRLNTEIEGTSWIPSDNPFTNAGQKTAVYSYGHRNPQGLVWGNVNGTNILYSSEHGPYSDDELNIIEQGINYGWPLVAGFCDNNYNGRYIGGVLCVNERNNCSLLNVREPIRSLFPAATPGDSLVSNMTWPSTAPSGTEFYGSNAIPGWQNSLLVAELKTGTIARFKLSNDGSRIISDTINYFRGKGRFRDVVVSPDGLKIYVACDSSGSTSGPTGNVKTVPDNPGSILEFTYQPASGRFVNDAANSISFAENLKDKSMDIYPNPAINYFVVYNYVEGRRTMELYDITGRLVRKQAIVNLTTRVNVNDLTAGVYILNVSDEKGKVIRTEKVIVQH
ncbi:MAG: fibronectin type III domain-containing protein [Bacteroidetes bacterium]|nr:fibronectin type III domain-containing protein [Bacteroidota bacterium]